MAEQRTESQVLADMDEIASKLHDEELDNLDEYKAKQRELSKELADIQSAGKLAQMQVQHTRDRNERIYNETMKTHFGVSAEELKRDADKGNLKTKFFESVIFSHANELAQISAQGEAAVREWMDRVATMCGKEVDKYTGADQKDAAKPGEDGAEKSPERPEPEDIEGDNIPTENSSMGDDTMFTPGEKAFDKMMKGERLTDLEHALIGRDVEISPHFEDPGLPIAEMSHLWRRAPQQPA